MKILFAGGGTAGHINPALAVAGYIKEKHPDAEISYIGTAQKLEAKLVPEKGYDFYTIDVAGFSRSLSPKGIAHNVSAVKKAVTASNKVKKLQDTPNLKKKRKKNNGETQKQTKHTKNNVMVTKKKKL